jgi:hypothetical protein
MNRRNWETLHATGKPLRMLDATTRHAMWVLMFTHNPTTLYQCQEVFAGVKGRTNKAHDLFEFAHEVRQKRIQRELRHQVSTVREWLDKSWSKRNVNCIVTPRKVGAGKLTVKVLSGQFKAELDSFNSGRYKGRCGYPIQDKMMWVYMPRHWNFIVDARWGTVEPLHNVAMPNGRTKGECMKLVKSRGYSHKWEKGYCYGEKFIPTKDWSPETQQKVITSLVRKKLEGQPIPC